VDAFVLIAGAFDRIAEAYADSEEAVLAKAKQRGDSSRRPSLI